MRHLGIDIKPNSSAVRVPGEVPKYNDSTMIMTGMADDIGTSFPPASEEDISTEDLSIGSLMDCFDDVFENDLRSEHEASSGVTKEMLEVTFNSGNDTFLELIDGSIYSSDTSEDDDSLGYWLEEVMGVGSSNMFIS